MLRDGIRVIKKKNLCYIAESENSAKRFKPWLGDSFSFLYDFIMKSSNDSGRKLKNLPTQCYWY